MIHISLRTLVGAFSSLFLLLSASVNDPDVSFVNLHNLLRVKLLSFEATSDLSQNEGAGFARFNLMLYSVVLNGFGDHIVNIDVKVFNSFEKEAPIISSLVYSFLSVKEISWFLGDATEIGSLLRTGESPI